MEQSDAWLLDNMTEMGFAMRMEAGKWLLELVMTFFDRDGEQYHACLEEEGSLLRLEAIRYGVADGEIDGMVMTLNDMVERDCPDSHLTPLLRAFVNV
jgi:hypothetical protein